MKLKIIKQQDISSKIARFPEQIPKSPTEICDNTLKSEHDKELDVQKYFRSSDNNPKNYVISNVLFNYSYTHS